MNKFKIGQYVMANIGCNDPDHWVLATVVDIEDDDVIVELIDEQYREEEVFSYIDLRQATNDDYINTLTSEQKAKFFYDIAHGKTEINWHDYPNQVHIKWLKSPYDGSWKVELENEGLSDIRR